MLDSLLCSLRETDCVRFTFDVCPDCLEEKNFDKCISECLKFSHNVELQERCHLKKKKDRMVSCPTVCKTIFLSQKIKENPCIFCSFPPFKLLGFICLGFGERVEINTAVYV